LVAQGTTAEVHASSDPFVYQFIRGEPDGPVAFHMKGGSYAEQLELNG
jgi:phospholipid/cholesterol/gamma-HCH transport system ATP-binding protein